MRRLLRRLFVTAAAWLPLVAAASPVEGRQPNVLVIITDDQGWGDFSFHGNEKLKTPHLDRLAGESAELTAFHVCPVCAPTRASLLTGRYNYRTGAIDTFLGRATMAADEVTLAEMLSAAGYRTGIFGKWHLGDNYPSRAMDQGFGESLVHRGGGIGQAADPPGNHYFDPVLVHNGRDEKSSGYCSDVFTDAAMRFIGENRQRPFFAYLAYNCPHTPLEVPDAYSRRYQDASLSDETAKVYGMVANIDDNLGRLFARLRELELENDTILVFLTDNGPQSKRYNGILRDLKGSVFDGGIRVACLVRWPGQIAAGSKVAAVAAHVDLVPTLLQACGVDQPPGAALDGVSLLPILRGQSQELPERLLFFQWHRGDVPERYRACAVRGPRYKLVQPQGREGLGPLDPAWALFDMQAAPAERHNLITQQGERAADMKAAYDQWFDDVGATRGYPPPRIIVGTPHENPTVLTRQDWRGPQGGWSANSVGHWDVDVADTGGSYDVTVRVASADAAGEVQLTLGGRQQSQPIAAGADHVTFPGLTLPPGTVRVESVVTRADKTAGALYVDLAHRAAK